MWLEKTVRERLVAEEAGDGRRRQCITGLCFGGIWINMERHGVGVQTEE